MKKEVLEMSQKEAYRHLIIHKTLEKEITQNKAAELLNLKSSRQVRNLISSYKQHGINGLISKHRGKQSNRAIDVKSKNRIMALTKEKYPDFGPTFAAEKLLEYHNITISHETLRIWMIKEKLWFPRKKHKKVYHLRPRRDYFGEMAQADASTHSWFEERGDKCALIVFIDDATSIITSAHFCESECLAGYFVGLEGYIKKFGRPKSIYTDRHAIFGGADCIHHAQFIRALKELDIESILAKSPQAKGRVERANGTLQDRLIKEMRLRNISNIEDANKYLPEFIDCYNKKFSKEPRGHFDAHRPLDSGYNLARILARREERTVFNDLSISYHSRYYQILEYEMSNRLKGKKVEVRQHCDGTIKIYFENKELKFIPMDEYIEEKRVLGTKEKIVWGPGKGNYPHKRNHPWRHDIILQTKLKDLRGVV